MAAARGARASQGARVCRGLRGARGRGEAVEGAFAGANTPAHNNIVVQPYARSSCKFTVPYVRLNVPTVLSHRRELYLLPLSHFTSQLVGRGPLQQLARGTRGGAVCCTVQRQRRESRRQQRRTHRVTAAAWPRLGLVN